MKIMAVNAGSSSIKFQLLEMPQEEVVASGLVESIGSATSDYTLKVRGEKIEMKDLIIPNHAEGVKIVLKSLIDYNIVSSLDEIKGVGHRVVQGGEIFKDSCIVDDTVIDQILELAELAPLHNKAHVVGIRAFKEALPNVKQVVVFDTTFHQTMEKDAYMYAIPYEWYDNYKLRKYGAHGTSHRFVSERVSEILNKKDSKIVVCHIGNGASICAVKNGKSVDTSMGLTPLEGIPMGTRTGNLDPTIVEYISNKEGKSVSEILNIFNKKSGYLGMSGVSHDARKVTEQMKLGNERCKMTFDVQAKRIADYVASYINYMEGCDAICFTAGIGENVYHLRENVCNRLKYFGVLIDPELNKEAYGIEKLISKEESKIKVFVIPTNEEVMIARDVVRLTNLK